MNTSRVGRLILYQWFVAAQAKARTKLPALKGFLGSALVSPAIQLRALAGLLATVPAGLERLSYPLMTALVDNQDNYFPHYLIVAGMDLLFLEEYLHLALKQY